MTEMTGRCLCGAVTYAARDVEQEYKACHCGMCRRWGGGPAFAVHVGSVEFRGEENIRRYDSSAWAERGFCVRCGSNLFYRLKPGGTPILWLGTLDDQTGCRLVGEIYIDAKSEGYNLAGDHPRLTEADLQSS